MLGCKKKYERLDKHYSSGKHGYTPEQALILSRRTDLSASTNTGRRRKRCPVPGCRSITSRLTTHLKNERIHHNLTSAEIERFRSMAGNWVPAKWMPFRRGREPPCLQDGVRRHPLFDRPLSGRCLLLHDLIVLSRLSRPWLCSWTRQSYSKIHGPLCLAHLWARRENSFSLRLGVFSNGSNRLSGGSRTEKFANQTARQGQEYFEQFGSQNVGTLNESNINTFINDLAPTHKPSSILFYTRSIQKYCEYSLMRQAITDAGSNRLNLLLRNVNLSLQVKAKKQRSATGAQSNEERLKPAIRDCYFDSVYIKGMVKLMSTPRGFILQRISAVSLILV